MLKWYWHFDNIFKPKYRNSSIEPEFDEFFILFGNFIISCESPAINNTNFVGMFRNAASTFILDQSLPPIRKTLRFVLECETFFKKKKKNLKIFHEKIFCQCFFSNFYHPCFDQEHKQWKYVGTNKFFVIQMLLINSLHEIMIQEYHINLLQNHHLMHVVFVNQTCSFFISCDTNTINYKIYTVRTL